MKKTLIFLFLTQSFLAVAVTTIPSNPRAGQDIIIDVAGCLITSTNLQGLTHLFEFTGPNSIELTVVTETGATCPPSPPLNHYLYPLGPLAEGNYDIDVYLADDGLTLPTTTRFLYSNGSFQVGPAPRAVNTMSWVTLGLLFVVLWVAGRTYFKRQTN